MRTVLISLLLVGSACEQPWELLETETTTETLRAVSRADDGTVYLGGTRIHRIKDQDATERLTVIRPNPRIEGILTQGTSVYAWMPGALLRQVGNSFTVMDLPTGVDNEPIADEWTPTAMIEADSTTIIVAASVAGRHRLFEWFGGDDWRDVSNIEDQTTEIVWLARSPAGALYGGDGRNGASVLVRRRAGGWEHVDNFELPGVLNAAATEDTLFVLTNAAVHAFSTTDFKEKTALKMEGTFFDICAFSDGRAVLVGPPQGPLYPVWILEPRGWANVNAGTREVLRAVHCDEAQGKKIIVAVGDHGMAVRHEE